ncbi:MAG: hypothetical protein LQ340_005170, partial [Diploschistes diacapsis]
KLSLTGSPAEDMHASLLTTNPPSIDDVHRALLLSPCILSLKGSKILRASDEPNRLPVMVSSNHHDRSSSGRSNNAPGYSRSSRPPPPSPVRGTDNLTLPPIRNLIGIADSPYVPGKLTEAVH